MATGSRQARTVPDLRHVVTGWELVVWDSFYCQPTFSLVLPDDGTGYWADPATSDSSAGSGEFANGLGDGWSADYGSRYLE